MLCVSTQTEPTGIYNSIQVRDTRYCKTKYKKMFAATDRQLAHAGLTRKGRLSEIYSLVDRQQTRQVGQSVTQADSQLVRETDRQTDGWSDRQHVRRKTEHKKGALTFASWWLVWKLTTETDHPCTSVESVASVASVKVNCNTASVVRCFNLAV